MDKHKGASPLATGPSQAEPEEVSALRASVPSAALNTDRELWRAREGDYYADSVHVTEGGGIGMHAAYGRVIVKTVGEWHYLATEVERLKGGYKSFPRDVAAVMHHMGDGEGVLPARDISDEAAVPEKRVKEILRALKVLGLADFGVLCVEDAEGYVASGSGYWLSGRGEKLSNGIHASGMSAGTAETAPQAQGEARQPGPQSGDAHPPSEDS